MGTVIIVILVGLGLLGILQDMVKKSEERERAEHIQKVSQYSHTYNNRTYKRGMVFKIKDYNSDEVVNAVYLSYNTETQRNVYQQIVGTTEVTCSDAWLEQNIISFTGETIDVRTLLLQKAEYHNFLWTCPMCKSHFVKEISGTSKAVSVAAVGVASKKIGKNYRCTKCDYQW